MPHHDDGVGAPKYGKKCAEIRENLSVLGLECYEAKCLRKTTATLASLDLLVCCKSLNY